MKLSEHSSAFTIRNTKDHGKYSSNEINTKQNDLAN
jgi:hypothetical protein